MRKIRSKYHAIRYLPFAIRYSLFAIRPMLLNPSGVSKSGFGIF
jgi:hypothetical protein